MGNIITKTIEMAYKIYDTYFDMGNRFGICVIQKIGVDKKGNETYCVYNINACFPTKKAITKLPIANTDKTSDMIIYHDHEALLKDVLLYNYKNNAQIDVDSLVESLDSLGEEHALLLNYNTDFCDIMIFENEDDIKSYIENYTNFMD